MDKTNYPTWWKSLFGDQTLEEVQEENRSHDLRMIEENPPLILSFATFAKGKYDPGGKHRYNLYIVWRGNQALYVGISRANIWNRWFGNLSPHILINAGGYWRGSSPIGAAIAYNRPASMRWKIEMRYIPTTHTIPRWDLESEERKLIQELHPLFNSTYLLPLTKKEARLYHKPTEERRITKNK